MRPIAERQSSFHSQQHGCRWLWEGVEDYDLCQLFEQNLPTVINTCVLYILFGMGKF